MGSNVDRSITVTADVDAFLEIEATDAALQQLGAMIEQARTDGSATAKLKDGRRVLIYRCQAADS